MPITLTAQTDAGDVATANTYGTLAEFKAHHDARGNSYGADELVKAAMVRSRDYLDTYYVFVGALLNKGIQNTAWPRTFRDGDNDLVTGIPEAVKTAQFELALIALSRPLVVNAPAPVAGQVVTEKRTKVDIIETALKFASASSSEFTAAARPDYPLVESILFSAGLITDLQMEAIR